MHAQLGPLYVHMVEHPSSICSDYNYISLK